jgi:hypothetical protein
VKRRAQQEDGAILLLTLAFLTFIGVGAAMLLNYTTTNNRATVVLRSVRAADFAADGVVEGAINKLRQNTALCATAKPAFFAVNPSPLNGEPVVVDCAPVSTTPFRVTFTARCDTGGSSACPLNTKLLIAKVRFEGTIPAAAYVESWSVL